jgi:hypothetical protein
MNAQGRRFPIWLWLGVCVVVGFAVATLVWRPWTDGSHRGSAVAKAERALTQPEEAMRVAAPQRVEAASVPAVDIGQIEARLAAIEHSGAPPRRPPPSRHDRALPSIEEDRAQHLMEHDGRLARHKAAQVDPSWAPRVSAAFQRDLGAIAPLGHFDVLDVDCRTDSCVATLEFVDYKTAQQNWRTLMQKPYQENCGCTVFLDEPRDGATKYQTSVVYNCVQSH